MSQASEVHKGDPRFRPGGVYCFHNWHGKPEIEPHKHHFNPSSAEENMDEFSEWRQWMKGYLKEKADDEKSQSSNTDSQKEELLWNTHVQKAREEQKRKAHELANAVVSSRQARTARMFQKRFERSEKFALVSEPGDKRPQPSPLLTETNNETKVEENAENHEIKNEENEHHEATLNLEENKESLQDDANTSPSLHPPLPPHLSFLNITPNTETLLVSPKPWKFHTDPVPPPPPQKNFNRSARGFAGSYLSSYH